MKIIQLYITMEKNYLYILSDSPLSQFEITDLFNINILNYINLNLTNIGLYLSIGCILLLVINLLSSNENKLVSNN